MSVLSELLPSGGGAGGSVKLVASGALSNGDTVVVNSDGTVSALEGNTSILGTAVAFEDTRTDEPASVFDSSNNKVVIVYQDAQNSNYGTAVVGTVSGTSISFGTPVVFYSGDTRYCGITFDSNSNKVVIAYRDNSATEKGGCVVGTVSGSSISFGTPVIFYNNTYSIKSLGKEGVTFDSSNNKVVIAWCDESNSQYGTAIVGTVSGTSISFGSPVVFHSTRIDYITTTFDSSNNKVVISYRNLDGSPTNFGTSVVGTVSGTSISFGTPVTFNGSAQHLSSSFDTTNNKVVIAFQNPTNSYAASAVVGTVSGTSISFGSVVTIDSGGSRFSSDYDSNTGKVAVCYTYNSVGKVVEGTVSGTSISFTSPSQFDEDVFLETSAVYDSNESKIVITYNDDLNGDYGTSVVYNVGIASLTSDNYIGIADADYTDGATATIQSIGSVNESQSGLTAGQAYYVQGDGTLSTTPADPEVFAGTAVAATKLIVKG